MLEKINLSYFIISFCIGIMMVYVTKPQVQIVHKFPSPTNLSTKYKDSTNNCYKYNFEEVRCTNSAIPQPIFEDFKKHYNSNMKKKI